MAVYVDPIREHPPFHDGWTLWCHMIADTEEELHAIAAHIGMRREWYQGDHYDLRPEGRARALQLGAVEMPTREMARRVCGARKAKRSLGHPCHHDPTTQRPNDPTTQRPNDPTTP